MKLLRPVQPAVFKPLVLAPRICTLDGQVVGLFSNRKLGADQLLELIYSELEREYRIADVIRGGYDVSNPMTEPAWGRALDCTVVILAVGDCGSCSSSGVVNALQLERAGIPTLLVSTEPFENVCRTMAGMHGAPNFRWAIVPHPIGRLDEATLAERARLAAVQLREIILEQTPVESSTLRSSL
jgi:hypothetical protein